MRVFIIGHKGWIAKKFIKIFENKNIQYIVSSLRGEDNELLNKIIEEVPTHVLCCMGRTHGGSYNTIDYLEDKNTLAENINDNLYVPVKLALFCNKNNIHFTYLGTGCIYNYRQQGVDEIFYEEDEPNFMGSSYSLVKKFTNNIINFIPCLHLRIRMPITYSKHPRNFITKITTYEKICSISNSMSVLEELIPIAISFMQHKVMETINFTNPGIISHNTILEMYKDIVDNSFTWENMSIDEQNKLLRSKRSNNHLSSKKLEELVKKYCPELTLRPIEDAIRIVLQNYDK